MIRVDPCSTLRPSSFPPASGLQPPTCSQKKPPPEIVKAVTSRETGIVIGIFLLLVFYTFFMEKLGFLIATPVSILIAMRMLLGMREWRFMLPFAISVTAVCWLFFVKLLETPLPRGLWLM